MEVNKIVSALLSLLDGVEKTILSDVEEKNHLVRPYRTIVLSWLHLSDLHIGCKETNRDWESLKDALLSDVKEHQQPGDKQPLRCAGVAFAPNLILVTGDIAFRADEAEYKQAEELLRSLWEITGLSKEQTFVVPGNHDVDRGVVQNDPMCGAAYKELADSSVSAQEWLASLEKWWSYQPFRDLVRKKFKHYAEFVDRCTAHVAGELYYAHPVQVSGTRIGIIGLNSAVMSWKDGEDRERGLWIGKPQLDAIEKALPKDVQFRITLVHHPQEALHEHDVAWGRIQQICSILLSGHMHKLRAIHVDEPEKEHLSLPGGSVHEGGVFRSQRYSYGQFDLDTGQLDLYLRMTKPDAYPIYIRDNQTYPNAAADGHLQLRLLKKT